MKFRKKPVVINAVQWAGSNRSFDKIQEMGNIDWEPGEMGTDTFIIKTLEGNHLVRKGDFIIRGVAGEFYPCKPDIFWKTYDQATSSGDDVRREDVDFWKQKLTKAEARLDAYQADRLRLYGACFAALSGDPFDDEVRLAIKMKEETDKARGEG